MDVSTVGQLALDLVSKAVVGWVGWWEHSKVENLEWKKADSTVVAMVEVLVDLLVELRVRMSASLSVDKLASMMVEKMGMLREIM